MACIVVLGGGVVAYGWLNDRRKSKVSYEELHAASQPIPGHEDLAVPEYITGAELAQVPEPLTLDDATRKELQERIEGAAPLPFGFSDDGYITDGPTGWAVMENPFVLVCGAGLTNMRELLPAIKIADGRPLVIVAPAAERELRLELAVNMRRRAFIHLLLLTDETDLVEQETYATPVQISELRAGYLPMGRLGCCDWWVSSASESWILS
ncbi:MAG: hypothetical protein LBR21_08580 [Propionibacteriaceae bacterium]|nr:hypothetical protein [Propionibacteriaceae bacterium]